MKYYRFIKMKINQFYNYWFKDNGMSIWALPFAIVIAIIAALISGLEILLFGLGAVIILPIDGILSLFNKALVWAIEKVFLRGEK